ncbi:type II secretion system minor pseudopilin GspJ [Sphingomonas abaci]|nr:type II secretion system minor pseudopilin GspJ [Sphingomonas abaci]
MTGAEQAGRSQGPGLDHHAPPRRRPGPSCGATAIAHQRRPTGSRPSPGWYGGRGEACRSAGFTPARRSAEHGFTLVEVMIALLIFAMIASAGVAILSFSIRAQAATGARLDDQAALARTVSALTADLAQTTPRGARDEAGRLRPAFVGEPGELLFTRGGWTNLDAAARPNLQKVLWRLSGQTLVRIGYPEVDGAQPLAQTPMLDRVTGMTIRYRYAGAWSDRWDGAGGIALPQALELRLTRADGTHWRMMALVGTGFGPGGVRAPGPKGSTSEGAPSTPPSLPRGQPVPEAPLGGQAGV